MRINEMKVGMKVKRKQEYIDSLSKYKAHSGEPVTIRSVRFDSFSVDEDDLGHFWCSEYFEPVIKETKENEMQNQDSPKKEIDITKKYRTRSGLPVRILCTDRDDAEYPVVVLVQDGAGELLTAFTKYGKHHTDNREDRYDLIEVSPYEEFKKDDKVMVSNDGVTWKKRYFAYEKDGFAYCYGEGRTSWSEGDQNLPFWNFCRKPTKEELANA